VPPFAVLHVCMGNICRSPMAERLLTLAVAEAAQVSLEKAQALVLSHSAGTGGWHEGDPMHPSAARQVQARGGESAQFVARQLHAEHLDGADLVLTATGDQLQYVSTLRPDAAKRTFVLGQFGRLLRGLDLATLPAPGLSAEAVHARGVALVAQVDAARRGAPPEAEDDLDDPWGRGERTFTRVADEIEDTLRPLAAALLPPVTGAGD
jgi:protein-tyrosine phosphatase